MSEPTFLLDANSLLSKWGFGDGDALSDWWWDNFDEEPPFNDHDALYTLVETHLVPELEKAGWEVELVKISTIHNPVRAERLNNIEQDWYAADHPDIPIQVYVTAAQIRAAAENNEREGQP